MNTADAWKEMVVAKNTPSKQIVVNFVQITTNWMEISAAKYHTILVHLNARQFWSKIVRSGHKQMDVSPAALDIRRLDTFSSANVSQFDLIIYILLTFFILNDIQFYNLTNLSFQSFEDFFTQRICHTVLIFWYHFPF